MELLPFLSKHRSTYVKLTIFGLLVVLAFAAVQMSFVLHQASPKYFVVPSLLGLFIGLMLATLVAMRQEINTKQQVIHAVADLAQEFIYLRRVDGTYEYVSPSCLKVTGFQQEDFYAKPNFMTELIHIDDRQTWSKHVHQMHEHGQPETLLIRINTRDGEVRWIEHLCGDVRDEKGKILGVRSINMDVTERIRKEQELWIAASAFETHDGIIITDANAHILRVNRAFCEITGYASDEVIGKTPSMLKSGRHDAAFYEEMWDTLLAKGHWNGELWDRRKNGEMYPKNLTITAVRDHAGKVVNYVGIFSDITARKQAEDEINRLAYYDPLTQLPNRRLLMDRLHQAMAASERNGSYGAVLFIDMDNFKDLNDTRGHDMGDSLLIEVAGRLVTCVRGEDTVARLGGDEFVVMLANLGEDETFVLKRAESVATKVLTMLNQPYQIGSYEYQGTASIGVTLFTGQSTSVEDLLKHSDVALYQAKNSGRATLRLFDPSMQLALEERSRMKDDLRRALAQDQFCLYFQAQVDADGHGMGAEVLLRWRHPQRGLVPPAEFIPFAEELGMIVEIDLWVLEKACIQLAEWSSRKVNDGLVLAVNISAPTFMRSGFVGDVLAIVNAAGIDPGLLKIELTETSLLRGLDDTIAKMKQLIAAGISFALDDFGTGYSSLSYLRRLPIDQLKIDREFVRHIGGESNELVIVRTIIGMAQNLGLRVIAEGVETQGQFEILRSFGCPGFQGYLFSRPEPVEVFDRWLLGSGRNGVVPASV
ncbi:MAG: EAL domain-containing protein [Nitrosomonadales bacterium]|nr:EAL domain-containing protein [Nitrosomonadales bacterium]